ncbi:MAG: hypothetical protein Q8R33_24940 [Burkholderiales bacterium]|nr:hypothetical protein [Burkholderiales bacterium]
MPTLTASVNGTLLAQVRTDGYDVMSVAVQGTCVEEEIAELMMTAGRYPEQGESVYLTWINSYPLKAGDLVEVTIQDVGDTSHDGKTLAELFPDEVDSVEQMDFTPTAELFADLRSRTRVRETFRFELQTNRGTAYIGETAKTEHGFGFTVLWNSQRPGRASLSLHSYTIDSLEKKEAMHDHVREYIEPFSSVRFRVDA